MIEINYSYHSSGICINICFNQEKVDELNWLESSIFYRPVFAKTQIDYFLFPSTAPPRSKPEKWYYLAHARNRLQSVMNEEKI